MRIGAGLCPALMGLVLWTAAAGPGAAQTFSHKLMSDRVNGEHTDLASEIAPVEFGPLMVHLSSPGHTLEVLEHELRLGPAADGSEHAQVWARYQGEADLVAELVIAGMTSEIEDHIELPLQEFEVSGRVELAREGDGYQITVLEAPSYVEVEVKSDLGAQMETLCQGFAVMTLGTFDCDGVGRAFSRVRLPLPEPGESYFVAAAELTQQERRQVEAYLRER